MRCSGRSCHSVKVLSFCIISTVLQAKLPLKIFWTWKNKCRTEVVLEKGGWFQHFSPGAKSAFMSQDNNLINLSGIYLLPRQLFPCFVWVCLLIVWGFLFVWWFCFVLLCCVCSTPCCYWSNYSFHPQEGSKKFKIPYDTYLWRFRELFKLPIHVARRIQFKLFFSSQISMRSQNFILFSWIENFWGNWILKCWNVSCHLSPTVSPLGHFTVWVLGVIVFHTE